MIFGRNELIRRLSDYMRKGWTDQQVKDLIDSLWRDPYSPRTAGFELSGGYDSIIQADVVFGYIEEELVYGILFSIKPVAKKFAFYQFREKLSYHKKFEEETITIPAVEGLHAVYYDIDEETKKQTLHYISKPQQDQLQELFEWVVPITFIYYDADAHEIIYFGDNRHGSLWNPWIHWSWHQTFNSMRETGLEFTDLVSDGDGSDNTHAQFGVSAGTCFHEDIYAISLVKEAPADFPVWYFIAGNKPRIHTSSTNSLVVDGLLCYNSGGAAVPATDGNFVMYHIFFTNDVLEPFISVMGQAQYESVSQASVMSQTELQQVKDKLPHQNMLHIGTLLFQTSSEFGNTYHTKIVTQTLGVITDMSVTGDGSVCTPVKLVNDEEEPDAGKVYGTDPVSGEKGWHYPDSRLSASGQAIYLHVEDSVISGYKQGLTDQPEDAWTAYTAAAKYGDGEVLIKAWDTGTILDGITVIPSGPWIFSHFMAVGGGSFSSVVVRVYKRDTGGNETEIFTFSQAVTATGATEHMRVIPQNLIEKETDEIIVVKYFHLNEDVATGFLQTMYLFLEGDETGGYLWSRVNIPLSSLSQVSSVITDMSVTGDGTPENPITLLNDEDDPGPWKYYGTDAYGIKRWLLMPQDEEGSGSGSGSDEEALTDRYVTSVEFDENSRTLTLHRSAELPDLTIEIPGGGAAEDPEIEFGFADVEAGTVQSWDLNLKSHRTYRILSATMRSDSTMDNVEVQINGTPVTFEDGTAIDVTTDITEFWTESDNLVEPGDRVTLVTSGTDGDPTYIGGNLYIERVTT